MNNRYAIVGPDNVAINCIAWDGTSPIEYGKSDGNYLVSLSDVGAYDIGWKYNSETNRFEDVGVKPVSPLAAVPASITSRQCRLELLSRGLLDQVNGMVSQQDQATQISWEYATVFERDNPLLTAFAQNLGLADEQIDEFFIAAALR